MKILVTGGAGFIGSALVRYLLGSTSHQILNVDALTYAGNVQSLPGVDCNPEYAFSQTDICDRTAVAALFSSFEPDAVMHLAAESHVDKSIDAPADFIQTNVFGTFTMLQCALHYWTGLGASRAEAFRFHHISTDEVYGDLAGSGTLSSESAPYAPSSPYSASKASADHLVRSWGRTYDLPVLISNCSNNYGPYQFPEKLIPHMILNALSGKSLPVYGDGLQVRDWLYVDDHAEALYRVVSEGSVGETYNIGGHNEKTNLQVVETLCNLLEECADKPAAIGQFRDLVTFVSDRPGHDRRYAIDASKIRRDLGWTPKHSFAEGMRKTVQWYLDNRAWWSGVLDGSYRLDRLGQASATGKC